MINNKSTDRKKGTGKVKKLLNPLHPIRERMTRKVTIKTKT